MAEIREIPEGTTDQAAAALLLLRPRWQNAAALVEFIDGTLRPAGYRLVGLFEPGGDSAVSVAGFRETFSTAWGHYLYVDDVSTIVEARGRGYADALLTWVVAEARNRHCEAVHLDSGVGGDRAAAHRLYMRHHLEITAHHFAVGL